MAETQLAPLLKHTHTHAHTHTHTHTTHVAQMHTTRVRTDTLPKMDTIWTWWLV